MEKDPSLFAAWFTLGKLLLQTGDDREAQDCLRRAAEIRPGNRQVLELLRRLLGLALPCHDEGHVRHGGRVGGINFESAGQWLGIAPGILIGPSERNRYSTFSGRSGAAGSRADTPSTSQGISTPNASATVGRTSMVSTLRSLTRASV